MQMVLDITDHQNNSKRGCIVVPCYNESENLPIIFEKISSLKNDGKLLYFDFVFVDDGSKDSSYSLLLDGEKKYSWLKIQKHEVNMGFAGALKTGRIYALDNSYGYIGQIDCDMTHPIELIENMVQELKSCDMVIASRYVRGGGMENVPLWRVFISKFSQFGFKILFRLKTKDATSGFRLCKRIVFEQISLCENTFAVQLELTVKAEKIGLTVNEIPFILVNRKLGLSKFSLRQYATYAKSVYRIFFNIY